MRYKFFISNLDGQPDFEVEATVIDVRPTELSTIFEPWQLADYGENKPTKAYIVTITEPSGRPDGFPEDVYNAESTIDMFAWAGLCDSGTAVDVLMLEFADGTIDVTLPEHDACGMRGVKLTQIITIEELAARLGVSLGTHSWEDLQMTANGHWTDESHTHWEFTEPLVDLDPPDKYTLQTVFDDPALADDLWTEWRVTNQGSFWFDSLPVEPPTVPNPETTDDAGHWDICLEWHNQLARYQAMPREELDRLVIDYRVGSFVGDGMEWDIAAGGSVEFRSLSEMTDAEVIKELMGIGDVPDELPTLTGPPINEDNRLSNLVFGNRELGLCFVHAEGIEFAGPLDAQDLDDAAELAKTSEDTRMYPICRGYWVNNEATGYVYAVIKPGQGPG